ncbi:MAG: choice-of-anchor L domain-containing protein, partial [Bacteroidetes bacterium]|nr:choice-of-anchor L domain-containing protein [Bacteroidota bacterium]
MIRRTFLFVFGALACSLSLNAQLQITPAINATDAEYMVENVLIGNGVAVSNITVNGQSVGTSNNFGMFQNGNSTNLGLASGIVLSSGNISAIPNPGSVFSSVVLGLSGDPVLQTIATEATYDVTYLEFDFVPLDTFIRFRYVFGSEEYPEYVGDLYNDVFGFFITGANPAGGAYTNYNIARIPGSNTVVSINNVNASSNSQYYVNNETGNTVVFDGMTTVLTAYADVEPCQLYHMKIAVGDVYDEVYDSGVFLEANSFTNNGNYDIPMVDLGPDMAVCEGSSVV